MTISIWRFAHLALAVFSSLFLTMASLTGAVLAYDAVQEKIPSYNPHDLNTITAAAVIPVLKNKYSEITQISIDHNDFVTLQAIDNSGEDINAYIDVKTGEIIGMPQKKSSFIQWITSLHRSLFLHETGRIMVGITAFFLLLISISGTVLIMQRQKSVKRFFSKIIKDSPVQYYHVLTGRLLLIPILILALTGTFLSMSRFNIISENKIEPSPAVSASKQKSKKKPEDFTIFKQLPLSEVKKIEFPFTEDPEEYYKVALKDRELIIDQFSGEVASMSFYPVFSVISDMSLNLHTGRANVFWACILGLASLNILFFIYSGFAMTFKRRSVKIKNRYPASESRYIILAGSENGSTLRFADSVHQQMLAAGEVSHLTEPNKYSTFPKAEHIILFTSTHGLGDPPSNSDKLISLIKKHPQQQPVKVSVVGFGSMQYPSFCGYARKVHALLERQIWTEPLEAPFLINDKSADEFTQWAKLWNRKSRPVLAETPAVYNQAPARLHKMLVADRYAPNECGSTFVITISPPPSLKFTSGDLLAIYPNNDGTERLYSIGKIGANIQLVVKIIPNGIGSNFLYGLNKRSTLTARIIKNSSFHIPKKSSGVIMISNGTGIAPFLGMIEQNRRQKDIYLYGGFQKETNMTLEFKRAAQEHIKMKKLKSFQIAFSREADRSYVMDYIKKDAAIVAKLLREDGTVMICGSLPMLKGIELTLNTILLKENGNDINYYSARKQILTDCY